VGTGIRWASYGLGAVDADAYDVACVDGGSLLLSMSSFVDGAYGASVLHNISEKNRNCLMVKPRSGTHMCLS
jgi:hypothetical protein